MENDYTIHVIPKLLHEIGIYHMDNDFTTHVIPKLLHEIAGLQNSWKVNTAFWNRQQKG